MAERETPFEVKLQIQLTRIMAKLKAAPTHAPGPRKPSLGQQEHGD